MEINVFKAILENGTERELGVLVVVKEFESKSWQSCIKSLDLADIFQQWMCETVL